MAGEAGGTRPPQPTEDAVDGPPLIVHDSPFWTAHYSAGLGSWDDVIRDGIANERARDRIRSDFVRRFRGWEPGTVVPLSAVGDRISRDILGRFLDLTRRERVDPPQVAYRTRGLVVPQRPDRTVRVTRGWPLMWDHSWAILLPGSRLSLQVPPDEYVTVVSADATRSLAVTGINAPSPYGLSTDDAVSFALEWCRLHRLKW